MGAECDPYPDAPSPTQRKWIYRRDLNVCQMPTFYIPGIPVAFATCGREGTEVHHIWPKRALVYQTGKDPHTPQNLILMCKYHHWLIHPDIAAALREKAEGNIYALEELFERRREQLRNNRPYWVTTWDAMLRNMAMTRTKAFLAKNPDMDYPVTYCASFA